MPQSKDEDRSESVEPCEVKASSTVLNGEDEETGRKALRLVLTQRQRWRPYLSHGVPQRRGRSRAALATSP